MAFCAVQCCLTLNPQTTPVGDLAVLLNKTRFFYDATAPNLTIALNQKRNEMPLCAPLQHQQYAKSVQILLPTSDKQLNNL